MNKENFRKLEPKVSLFFKAIYFHRHNILGMAVMFFSSL